MEKLIKVDRQINNYICLKLLVMEENYSSHDVFSYIAAEFSIWLILVDVGWYTLSQITWWKENHILTLKNIIWIIGPNHKSYILMN